MAIVIPGDGADLPPLAGWWNPPVAQSRGWVAVVAYPAGYEFTHGYRAFRHLAQELAQRGIAVLRFDYAGTGDSADAPTTVENWENDLARAVRFARETSGGASVAIIGVRLGALIAARVAASSACDALVLWNPVIQGRRYVREIEAVAALAADSRGAPDAPLEAAGFVFDRRLTATLRELSIDPGSLPHSMPKLAILPEGTSLTGFETRPLLDWIETVAEPQFTRVPSGTLGHIGEWFESLPACAAGTPLKPTSAELRWGGVVESAFSEDGLTGVYCAPDPAVEIPRTSGPRAVLLLNSGSVHRTGPHRLYTLLARELARAGIPSLRLDFRGLGESYATRSATGEDQENHPYPESASTDTRVALRWLRQRSGARTVTLAGICSGAHAAWRALLDSEIRAEGAVAESILVNPLTFRWQEGMSLETTAGTQLQEVEHYRQSFKRAESWKKLLRGQVQVGHALKFGARQLVSLAKNRINSLKPTELGQELLSLSDHPARLSLWVSPGDPGLALLRTGAPGISDRLISGGRIQLRSLSEGDHTFSRHSARQGLIAQLVAHIHAQPN